MTYSEFIEGVPKLTCIWLPQWRWSEGFKADRSNEINIWTANITTTADHSVVLHIVAHDERDMVFISFYAERGFDKIGFLTSGLEFNPDGTPLEPPQGAVGSSIKEGATFKAGDLESEQIWQRFSPQWMPYFRRGCWLSGFPIECSAHEQLDWAMWLEQRDQEWAMWNEEQAVKGPTPRRGFSIGPFSDIVVETPKWGEAFAKFRKRGRSGV